MPSRVSGTYLKNMILKRSIQDIIRSDFRHGFDSCKVAKTTIVIHNYLGLGPAQ